MGWWEVVSCGEVSGLLLVMSWIKKNSIEILNGFIQCIQPLRTMCLHRKKKNLRVCPINWPKERGRNGVRVWFLVLSSCCVQMVVTVRCIHRLQSSPHKAQRTVLNVTTFTRLKSQWLSSLQS